MKNKCVFIIGPEGTGSRLIARICSHALGIQEYGEWNGVAWSDNGQHKVCHRSLPYSSRARYPNIEKWISDNEQDHDIYFILATRDITISELSRVDRWGKPLKQVKLHSEKAREIMIQVIHSGQKYFIWSYETFMFFGKAYLDCLYEFLDIASDFVPPLVDGNKNRIMTGRLTETLKFRLFTKIRRSLRPFTKRLAWPPFR